MDIDKLNNLGYMFKEVLSLDKGTWYELSYKGKLISKIEIEDDIESTLDKLVYEHEALLLKEK